MGKGNATDNLRTAEPVKGSLVPPTGTGTGTGTAAGSTPRKSASGNSPAATPRTGTPTAAGSGTAAGTDTGTVKGKAEQSKSVPELVDVKVPPVPDAPKKKQRKPRQPKKKEPQSFNAEQISALIVSLSTVIATRDGLQMFAISEVEAMQIATPLSNMIAKSEALSGLSEHSDAIALVTASFVIMLPRLMMFFEEKKKKKLQNNGGVKLVRTDSKDGKSRGNSGKSDTRTSDAVQNDVSALFAAMPPIAD